MSPRLHRLMGGTLVLTVLAVASGAVLAILTIVWLLAAGLWLGLGPAVAWLAAVQQGSLR